MRIPPEKIEEVRNATDIVENIGAFVRLKKRGKNYIGLCPFHEEKTPSFNVSAERQMYHCFGCGVGGNVFTFMMEYEKVSFGEAVRSLADKAGILLPQSSQEQQLVAREEEQLYQVCQLAEKFYVHSMANTNEGKLALEYFRHRGFTDDTIRKFGLGYSPNSWDAFVRHADEQKYSSALLEKGGLGRTRNDGTRYDYFRGRAMFPIYSTAGRVVGFGARKLLEDDPLGKYINSPETLIYNKSRILYGLYQSKESIRERDYVILVEGYADLISVHQAGVKNVVASSGTALTQEQIQLINRYTKNITIVYDADSAGSKAALRGVDLVLENDMDVRVASLPKGDDPDSFVKRLGGDAFRKLIEESVSFIDFIADAHERQGKFDTPESQAETVRTIVRAISKIHDELKRNFYIKQVAQKYNLYESTLYREMEKNLRSQHQDIRSEYPVASARSEKQSQTEASPVAHKSIPTAEKDLIHAMLEGGTEAVKQVFEHLRIEDFTHPSSKALAMQFLHSTEEGKPLVPSSMLNEVEDPVVRKFLSEIVFSKYQLSKDWDESRVQVAQADPLRIAADAILVMQRRALEKMMEENQQSLKRATTRGEDITPYLERNMQLVEQRKALDIKEIKP